MKHDHQWVKATDWAFGPGKVTFECAPCGGLRVETWSKVRICLGCGVDLGPDCLTEYERCPICGIEPAGWATIAWVLGEKAEDPAAELTLGLTA